ncbi:MAG: replicative DNA helicase [Leptotrichia hongkongensis]
MMYNELEAQVLGAIHERLVDLPLYLEWGLKTEHFLTPEYKEIFQKMLDVLDEKGKVDVGDFTKTDEEWDLAFKLMDNCKLINLQKPISDLIESYNEYWIKSEIGKILENEYYTLENKVERILQKTNELDVQKKEKNKVFDMKDLSNIWYQDFEDEKSIVKTPFEDVNRYFTFEPGSLVIVGARPAMGKTAFALNLALQTSKNHNVLYVNLEMSNVQIMQRFLSIKTGIELNKIKNKKLNDDELTRINFAVGDLQKSSFKSMSCEDNNDFNFILRKIKKEHEREKLNVVIIDYLTLMTASGFQSKNYEVEYMANRLKLLATELNCCIVILAQLNRAVETRGTDKRPLLADLRDSGGIEQASNVVAFLHREDYYRKNTEENKNDFSFLEFIIRKNRSGELGTVTLGYNKKIQRIGGLKRD